MACLSPIRKTDKKYGVLWLDCGICVKCVIKRRNDWTFRLMQEHQDSITSAFVTLTYNDSNLNYGNENPSLYYRDLQNYFKRLRKISQASSLPPIKYYAVGEYGEKNKRPHYHAIIFNALPDKIFRAWTKQKSEFSSDRVSMGIVHTGSVTQESIYYVTKYVHKRKQKEPDDTMPQKALMSKNLGYGYIKRCGEYHKKTKNTFVTYPGGYKASLPRYYARKIWEDNDRQVIYRNQHLRRERQKDKDSGRKRWLDSVGTDLEKATYPIYTYNQEQIDKKEIEKIRFLEHMLDKKAISNKV